MQNNSHGLVTAQRIKTEIICKEYVNKTAYSTDKRKPKSVNKVDTGIINLNEENTIKFKDKKDK